MDAAHEAARQRLLLKRAEDEAGLEAMMTAREILDIAKANQARITKSRQPVPKRARPVAPPTPADLKREEIRELRRAMANRPLNMKATDAQALTKLYDELTELEKFQPADLTKAMGSRQSAALGRTVSRIDAAHWRRIAETITDPDMKRAYLDKAVAIEREIP